MAHGFRSVTMDDLASELGMSKKTLYAQFATKQDLVKAVLLDKLQHVEADFEKAATTAKADFLAALGGLLASLQQHTQEIQPPFVRDVRRDAPELFKQVEARRQELIQRYFGRLFEQGQKAGLVRKDVPTAIMIEMLLSAVHAIMNPQRLAELELTPNQAYSAIMKIVLEGALAPDGRRGR